ncbi:uncharacterized protein LOC114975662 [Acropora millepora]|uniref:uncharacterized protein LOC114975662 n=1 Tax=Acropora millepora TaxID=45264 RepID=UPI0010FCC18A|nr:uncharacterized protein LOC114975662 [Acropora millepora]
MKSRPSLLFVLVLLLFGVTLITGRCDLYTYKGSNFMNSARVHSGFAGNIKKINDFAAECGVKVYVTSSFRKSGQAIKNAIVQPATRSNHFVGHAIDMNLVEGSLWCNSKCLQNWRYNQGGVSCFIQKIRASTSLRWGGDFSKKDPVHIDDGLNYKSRSGYDTLYNLLQKNCI